MPLALQRLGNKKAWDAVHAHLTTRASSPLVLQGPTGCGKTAGLTCLLEAMRLRPVFLDAVEADDVSQLVVWIKRARDSDAVSTEERRRAVVVVDDVEGFGASERALDALATLARDEAPGRNPLVFVLHNARDPKWKRFSTLPTYRLFAPNQHVASEWFRTHHEWTTSDAKGVVTRRKGFSQALLDTARSVLACGDLRRIATHLVFAATTGVGHRSGNDSFPSSIFDATRRLFRATLDADAWAGHAEPRDLALLQYHTPSAFDDDDIEGLARALDVFSEVDASRPGRYEHVGTFDRWGAHAVATSTRCLTNPARDVGALCPPPRATRTGPLPDTDDPVDALNRRGWR